MLLLGISGKRRSGKTLLANMLERHYGYEHFSLAGALKEEVREFYELTREHTDGELKEVTIPRLAGKTPRTLMIEHGKMRREEDPEYWISRVQDKVNQSFRKKAVISDIRFINEAEWIKRQGGYLVRLERSHDLTGRPINDLSETGLDDYSGFDLQIPECCNVDEDDMREIAKKVTSDVSFWEECLKNA